MFVVIVFVCVVFFVCVVVFVAAALLLEEIARWCFRNMYRKQVP